MSLIEIGNVLHDSDFGTALRESVYVYPIVEGLHLVGLAFSVGLILFVDSRLVGLMFTQVPIQQVMRPLRPWLLGGFLVTFATGISLFVAEAAKTVNLGVFQFKLVLIALAGVNALWFEFKWGRKVAEWQNLEVTPAVVRFAGWTSLTLWTLVVICGRMIPYLNYK
ncbi:MAG TPA: DUF6644 family protein [Candidatus Acidoferrum sp.]|nr:DUF6644 family protein [Candidatus Acidoferrum sp.]